MRQKKLTRPILIGMVGNILEWYDFSIYAYLSIILAKLFFPESSPTIALIQTFGVFAAGFLIRPLGSIFFGYIGDRMGRKQALFYSILLISVPTVLIAFLPTYESIGMAAPCLLMALRMIQGLSIGGEFPSSMLYLTEHAPPENRGFAGSFAFVGSAIGWLLGSFSASITLSYLGEAEMLLYGWRLLFGVGILTALWGIILRNNAEETAEFKTLQKSDHLAPNPIKEVATTQRKMLGYLVGINFLPTIAGYLLYAYMPSYLHQVSGIPFSQALMINTFALCFNVVLIPLVGALSDRVGRMQLQQASAVGFLILSYPLFQMFSSGDLFLIGIGMAVGTVLITLFNAPLPALMVELFPSRVRSSGVSIGYTIGACLYGGTCPLIASTLVEWTGNPISPVYYLMGSAVVSLLVVSKLRLRERSLTSQAV